MCTFNLNQLYLEFAKHTYEKGFINEGEFKRMKNAMDEALSKVAKYHESQDVWSLLLLLFIYSNKDIVHSLAADPEPRIL